MPIVNLRPASILDSTGWTNATVASLESVDGNRATNGRPGDIIRFTLDNAPADFGAVELVRAYVVYRRVGNASRAKSITLTLHHEDGEALTVFGASATNDTEASLTFSTVTEATVGGINEWEVEVGITEGGGMADSATIEIDAVWIELTYDAIIEAEPDPPLELTATAISSSQINLEWAVPNNSGSSPITGYQIERESPVNGGWSTLVADTGNTNTTYQDTDLTEGTQYNYRVSAINDVGIGLPSDPANATTGSNLVSGTLSTTEEQDTVDFVIATAWVANLNATEISDQISLAGDVAWIATLLVTEDQDSVAVDVDSSWKATLATTEELDVVLASVDLITSGILSVTENPDITSFRGVQTITGILNATETKDTASVLGDVASEAVLNAAEEPDSISFDISVMWIATIHITENPDIASINSSFVINTEIDVTEVPDTLSVVGFARSGITFAAVEEPDVFSVTLSTITQATLNVTEQPDRLLFDGSGAVRGDLVATEETDSFIGTATLSTEASFIATEQPDIANIAALITVDGTLAATDSPDSAQATAGAVWAVALAAIEPADAASMTASVTAKTDSEEWQAVLDATEDQDSILIEGQIPATVRIYVTENLDVVELFTKVALIGILDTTENPDIININNLDLGRFRRDYHLVTKKSGITLKGKKRLFDISSKKPGMSVISKR